MQKKKVNEIITDKILDKLEAGTVPWHKPWQTGRQKNAISNKSYTGINQWLLQIVADEMGYKSSQWLTYKQATSHSGSVKGQHGTQIVFWSVAEKDEEDKKLSYAFLKYYYVFNRDQVVDLDLPEDIKELEKKPKAEQVINTYLSRESIELKQQGNQAFYNQLSDYIQIPIEQAFDNETGRYATLFHEIIHSTGHKKRLDRFDDKSQHNFGSIEYSKEELVAELGASILCHETGIKPDYDQSSAYIKSWIKALKNDKNMIISASSKADKASNYILGK